MFKIRLRTKFLLSLVFITAALTCACLLIVQNYLGRHARREIYEQLNNSLVTFQKFAQQRQRMLTQSAEISANLPNVRALMTTHHESTIQDASTNFWQLASSDLFLLADPEGHVMALHTTAGDFDRASAAAALTRTWEAQRSRDWWFGAGHLYEVYLQPIYFGAAKDGVLLGELVTGFEVDGYLATAVAQVASSQVAFRYGDAIVVSTLLPDQQQELAGHRVTAGNPGLKTEEIRLGGENFLGATVALVPSGSQPVTLTVLKSYDAATLFLQNLNRLLLGVGVIAVLAGAGLIFVIADTFTRPLAKLVSGVHALEGGDFEYPLDVRSHDEIGEVTSAFDKMRRTLMESQQRLLHSERLSTIGRMASSISHDLRHPLAAILAYTELLQESNLTRDQRNDAHEEIRLSVHRMTALIASLLEFSKARESLQLAYGDVVEALRHNVNLVQLRPEFKHVRVTLRHQGSTQGWFDFRKLDRAFQNVLQNACEAVPAGGGQVDVTAQGMNNHVEIFFSDNGTGVPEAVRDQIFQPFVTCGKEGGTGLGLAVAQKIVTDHGGEVRLESSGSNGTTFRLILPIAPTSMPARS